MALIIFYQDRKGNVNLNLGRRVQEAYSSTEGFPMESVWFSATLFRFLTLRLMTCAQAVLNAPVSIALLPNTLSQKGSCLARCAEQSCWSSRDLGRQRE